MVEGKEEMTLERPAPKYAVGETVWVVDSDFAFVVETVEWFDGRWKYAPIKGDTFGYRYSEERLVGIVERVIRKPETPIESTLTERGKNYGKFKDQATIAQMLESVLRGNFSVNCTDHTSHIPAQLAQKWNSLQPFQRESLKMITHKIARIMNGNPDYDDSWRDISGYATLVVEILNGKVR